MNCRFPNGEGRPSKSKIFRLFYLGIDRTSEAMRAVRMTPRSRSLLNHERARDPKPHHDPLILDNRNDQIHFQAFDKSNDGDKLRSK